MTLRVPDEWLPHLEGLHASVFAASDETDDEWETVAAELDDAFELSQPAAAEPRPIVYVVHHDDLLGRRGAGRAMVATGLLSAARTAAVELARRQVPVNVLAIEDDTPVDAVCRWIRLLCDAGGPTGELVRIGSSHIGKALP